MKEEPIASVHIHKAGEMTVEQRKQVAAWLRERAKDILKEGKNYSTHFRAGFYWG